jgi:hypothetical protein
MSMRLLLLLLFDLKREVFLCHIAETYYDHGRQHLGDGGIDMELFYEQLDEDDVEADADEHQHEIPEQLYPAMQRAARKSDIAVQEETCGKAYTKSDEHRSDIGRDGRETQMDIVLMQNVVEAEPIHHDIHNSTRPPASGIPKGLQRHDPAKRRIKEIYKRGYVVFQSLCHHIEIPSGISIQRYRQKPAPPKMWERCITFAANW